MSVRIRALRREPLDTSGTDPWIMVPMRGQRQMQFTGRFDRLESTSPGVATATWDRVRTVTIAAVSPGRTRIRALAASGDVLATLKVTVKARRHLRLRFHTLSDGHNHTRRTSATHIQQLVNQANDILTPQTNVQLEVQGIVQQLAPQAIEGRPDGTGTSRIEQVEFGRIVTENEVRPVMEPIMQDAFNSGLFACVFLVWEYESAVPRPQRNVETNGMSFGISEDGLCQLGNSCARMNGIVIEDRCSRTTLAHEVGHCLVRHAASRLGYSEGHSPFRRDLMFAVSPGTRIREPEADVMNASGA